MVGVCSPSPKMDHIECFIKPWHLTVVRTRGLVYVRPEKSWRPIVAISVVDDHRDHGLSHEVVLGSDGQNPNLKSTIPIQDISLSTRIIVHVYHKSQTKRKHRKRNLVGSASFRVTDILNKHPPPHSRPVEYDVRLACPPPQRKSPTIGGRQQHSATLTMKFHVPQAEPTSYESPPVSPISEHHDTDGMVSDGASSSRALSETLISSTPEQPTGDTPWGKRPELDTLDGTAGLRRRKTRRLKGFHIDSDSCCAESSSDEDSCGPSTPREDYFPPIHGGNAGSVCEDEAVFSPSMLPLHGGQGGVVSMRTSLSVVEGCVDRFAPYHELREAEEEGDCDKAERVLGRLMTEWYVVGASLLGLAGIDAAVFGFGSDALFAVDGFSRAVVSIGAIAAGIGLVCDAWFLMLYSGASAAKFLRCTKDVYDSYFFFCLTCRLPTVCMFVSTLALMAFLLAVAWTAWPTAVLVMSFVAGFLLTSQFLVFGIHRFVNLVVWLVRVAWRKVAGGRQQAQPPAHSQVVVQMPVPCPAPAVVGKTDMEWAEPAHDLRSE